MFFSYFIETALGKFSFSFLYTYLCFKKNGTHLYYGQARWYVSCVIVLCVNPLFIFLILTGVQRGLVGEIIKRFESRGYQLMALELLHPTKEHLEEHVSILDIHAYLSYVANAFHVNLVQGFGWQAFLPWFDPIHAQRSCCWYGLGW